MQRSARARPEVHVPSTMAEVPPQLWALVNDLLNTAGLSKVAKSLVKRLDAEVSILYLWTTSKLEDTSKLSNLYLSKTSARF